MSRTATVERSTKETKVAVSVDLDGRGAHRIATGVGFFDHMLTHVAVHGLLDLDVQATGDLEVDAHHVVEDVGIVLGQALRQAAGDKSGMVRYGAGMCPMDEALVVVALDFGGRAHLEYAVELPAERTGQFDTELAREFFAALAANAGLALHLRQESGLNSHHILESAFKSLGRALDQATALDPRLASPPSTKGMLV